MQTWWHCCHGYGILSFKSRRENLVVKAFVSFFLSLTHTLIYIPKDMFISMNEWMSVRVINYMCLCMYEWMNYVCIYEEMVVCCCLFIFTLLLIIYSGGGGRDLAVEYYCIGNEKMSIDIPTPEIVKSQKGLFPRCIHVSVCVFERLVTRIKKKK